MALGADCFHLNQTGYRYLGERLWESFYSAWICPDQTVLAQTFPDWPQTRIPAMVAVINRFCPAI